METLKVAAASDPKAVASAIAAIIDRGEHEVALLAIGAAAVNQAVKAIAITRGYIAPKDKELFATVAFSKLMLDGKEKTAIKFYVEAL